MYIEVVKRYGKNTENTERRGVLYGDGTKSNFAVLAPPSLPKGEVKGFETSFFGRNSPPCPSGRRALEGLGEA
jgi:hypothetical protein